MAIVSGPAIDEETLGVLKASRSTESEVRGRFGDPSTVERSANRLTYVYRVIKRRTSTERSLLGSATTTQELIETWRLNFEDGRFSGYEVASLRPE